MLLDNWVEFSEQEIIDKGFDEYFYPFVRKLIYDEVENDVSGHEEIEYIGTAGIGCHTDKEFPNYSYHLVLRNQRLIAKGYRQNARSLLVQLPGTIIVLNNWKPHHVTWDTRIKKKAEPLWISAFFDSHTLLTKKDVRLKFAEFIRNA